MRVLFLFAAVVAAVSCLEDVEEQLPQLEGMQSLEIFCDTEEKLRLVRSYEGVPGFDFTRSTSTLVEVLVTADEVGLFKKFLDAHNISFLVSETNVKDVVIEDYIAQQVARKVQSIVRGNDPTGKLPFTYYPQYDEIINYLEYIVRTHGNVAESINIGLSTEGRALKGLKLSTPGKNKPAVYIDAGIHAREWIAPATALYIIDQLVANKTNNHLIQNVDWYIFPLTNPDGYQFTHSSLANRLWRKTRSTNAGSRCRGVDGNRNYDMEWMTIGSSDNACSDIYAGPKPASEPEVQAIQNFILSKKGTIKVYMTLHSYGQYILYPWGYTTALPANEKELRQLASECAKAIADVRNTRFTIGTSANALYPSSGGSDDWAMAVGGTDLAYTYELPGGIYGFVLPPKEIIPVGVETFEAVKVVHKHVNSKYRLQRPAPHDTEQ